MAVCVYCRAETQLFCNEVPVCVKCADERSSNNPTSKNRYSTPSSFSGAAPRTQKTASDEIRRLLESELDGARADQEAARIKFESIISDVPAGLARADSVRRIQKASRDLSDARQRLSEAYVRLNAFLIQGFIPDHLKKNVQREIGSPAQWKRAAGQG